MAKAMRRGLESRWAEAHKSAARARKGTAMRIAIGLVGLLLTGCATFSSLETGLDSLVGQPFSAATAKLGYPSNQMKIGEETVYGWGRAFDMSVPTYRTGQTSGYVGTKPFNATTGYAGSTQVSFQCSLKIVVGPDQIIRKWSYDGNAGGCEGYAGALKS
jgi:hypothetical protein